MTSTSCSCLSGEISARDTFLLCKVINKEGEGEGTACGERGDFCKEWEEKEERNSRVNEEGPRVWVGKGGQMAFQLVP